MEIKTGIYKHFKGRESLVIGVAKHSDSNSDLVIYKGLQDGNLYARPYESFIEKVTDENGKEFPRFKLIKELDIKFGDFN